MPAGLLFPVRRFPGSLYLIAALFLAGCTSSPTENVEVYRNTFETNSTTGITGGILGSFKGSKVLGMYNNSGFELNLQSLAAHDRIRVSFVLNIHDTWDGNLTAGGIGPDFWELKADTTTILRTTFLNRYCNGPYDCGFQSYPGNYPQNNYGRTGAVAGLLVGNCVWANYDKGGSRYEITRYFSHSGSDLKLTFRDYLKEQLANKFCDESWSLDDLTVYLMND